MIPFALQPEPAAFQAKVRSPGTSFLATVPVGTKVKYRGKEYWRACKDDLREAFGHVCAYTSLHVEEVTGADTVEHYLPKDNYPNLAYEWTNFRFVCSRMNGRKGTKAGVMDPFLVPAGLFQIDFPSMLMTVNLAGAQAPSAVETIKILRLNDEKCTRSRFRYAHLYATEEVTRSFLSQHAPLIDAELTRQAISRVALAEMFQKQPT